VFEDLAAQFDIGRLDIGDKAHRQAREQTLLHPVQGLRRAVGGEDQPLAFGSAVHRSCRAVLPARCLADDELDVIDQQHVKPAQP
jgi:hypothetical protein